MFDVSHKLPVSHDLDDGKIRSRDVIIDTQVKFSTLLLEPQIHDGLAKCGYVCLSPIQQNALPLALTGSSIIAHAKSGTGKTLIYVLPILNELVKRKLSGLHCIVLAPTREIAAQIYNVFQNVACYVKGLQIEYFIGGTPLDMDVIKCMSCHLAIGAPGRIKHLIDLGYLKTADLEFLVLDEVDALFDHKEFAVEDIISTLPPLKQLIVCTATFSSKVGDLVKSVVPSVKYISADTSEIEEIGNISNMLIAVKQYVAPVKMDSSSMVALRKREKLVEVLKKFDFEQCFIFVNYMTLVRSICNHLISQNFSALWICSDQNQSSRINTINKLKMNHCKILVTTDLAARGIDVHKVNLVINLGLPCPPEIYIHRMGRAGRYGSEGAVITILGEGEEMTTFTKMISVISTDPIDLFILPEQIDASMSKLDVIQCLPADGSISMDEFSFKRQIKDNQEKIAVRLQNDKKIKKKKRKSAKASKLALEINNTDQLSSVNKNYIEIANHEGHKPVPDEKVNELIKQYQQSLTDFLVAGELVPEFDSLEYLFGLKDDSTAADESFSFVQNPPATLLTYALHIIERNKFIDEQIVPCSIDEFLSLLNLSNGTFDRHSSGLCCLIKEICGKIERPAKQQFNVGGSVTSSDISSFDSEQSEVSSQVSSVGITSLSQQLLETMNLCSDEKNFSERSIKKNNAYSRSKKFSGSFSLAEEFSNAMKNFGKKEHSSSLKQPTSVDVLVSLPQSDFPKAEKFEMKSSKQLFNNCRRLNSDVEDSEYPKEMDSELKHLKQVYNEIERPHQSLNILQDSVAANICSQNTYEEHKIPPNQLSKNLNHSNQLQEGETQLHDSVNENQIQANKTECTLSLSNQFSLAVNNSVLENGPQNSFPVMKSSLIDSNHSNSILPNGQLPKEESETPIKAKHVSKDFNLSDHFLNTVGHSLVEANSQNLLRKSESSPQPSPKSFTRYANFSSGTRSKNQISEKRVSTGYSSNNISLSDQFSASVLHCESNCYVSALNHESSNLNVDVLVHGTSNIPDSADQHSAAVSHLSSYIIPGSIPNNEEVSGYSFNLVSDFNSRSSSIFAPDVEKPVKSTSRLVAEVKFKPESSTKSILVPEIESKSNISTPFEMNHSFISKNEANKESSLHISNFKQHLNCSIEAPSDLKANPVAFANYRSEYKTEHAKNDVKTSVSDEPKNRLARKFEPDCLGVRDGTCDGNVKNTVHKSTLKNIRRVENFEASNNAVIISSKPVTAVPKTLKTDCANLGDKTDPLNLLSDVPTAVTLPSLRSHVSGQHEQKIWRHHFAFIRRHAVSKGRVTASQWQ